ncbi:MAG: phosphoenolpyruvate--protein phosphotransferase [Desulfobacteraceae bacterium]|nr:phosphoenolpyruvate--protein phosphotransferase [Desulfobacteraceae bacterium]MBU4054631.1 phosphoenolpyruvate--protein phosphotransferase [Pseudomonadota bacterium]
MLTRNTDKEIRMAGIGASPGICIGKAYIVDREGVDVVEKYSLEDDKVEGEKKRFRDAVRLAREELKTIIDNTPDEIRQHTNIFEIHIALLKDKMLYGKTLDFIGSERVNAEWALKKVSTDVKAMFRNMEDNYFQERASDISHVSDRIMRNLVGMEMESISDIDKRVILIAHDLSPTDTSQIRLEKIKGFVTDRGGKASHTSIIARTLEIPAVLGMGNATEMIRNDDVIIVDGTTGIVIINPTEKTLFDFEDRKARYEVQKALIAKSGQLVAQTIDGVRIQIHGNIELPEEVVSVIDYGGDGIGLYRTEFQYLSRAYFPTEKELYDKYKEVVEMMYPKSVTIRTLDINGDKAVAYATDIEDNPALGLRAIRYCLKKPEVFKTQLRAILRAAVFGNTRILFPMISSCEEIREAKAMLEEAATSLEEAKIPFNRDVEIGIMIEVPSAVIMAEAMADEVDFFSIGTNDLIQYSLAIDRGNRKVAHLYQPFHPAIIQMIKHVVEVGKKKGKQVCMCGEMAGDPLAIPILLGLGIDELSMNPQSIPAVKQITRMISVSEAEEFIKVVLKKTTAKEINELLEKTYGRLVSEQIYS